MTTRCNRRSHHNRRDRDRLPASGQLGSIFIYFGTKEGLLVSLVEQREQQHVVPSKTGDFSVCSRRGTTCSNLRGKRTEPVIVSKVNGLEDDDLLVGTLLACVFVKDEESYRSRHKFYFGYRIWES